MREWIDRRELSPSTACHLTTLHNCWPPRSGVSDGLMEAHYYDAVASVQSLLCYGALNRAEIDLRERALNAGAISVGQV